MPVPSNITPETAIDLAPLPYTVTVSEADLELAPEGTGYPTSGSANQHNALWWKYTTRSGELQLAFQVVTTPATNYTPILTIWTGTPGSLTEFYRFTTPLDPSLWYYVYPEVQEHTTYYLQIVNDDNDPDLQSGLSLTVHGPAREDVDAGTILISSDVEGTPASVVDLLTGEVLRLIDYPTGEMSDWVVTGEQITEDDSIGTSSKGVAFLDANYDVVAQVTLATLPGTTMVAGRLFSVKSNKSDTFYVLYKDFDDNVRLQSFTLDGTPVTNWDLGFTSTSSFAHLAVAQDDSIAYVIDHSVGAPIKRYNLGTSTLLSDWTGFTGEIQIGRSDGFVDADGYVYFAYRKSATLDHMRKFNPADGSVVVSWDMVGGDGMTDVNRWADYLDGTSAVIWGYDFDPGSGEASGAIFTRRSLADGSIISTNAARVPVDTRSDQSDGSTPFGISDSCPIMMMPVALASLTSPSASPSPSTPPPVTPPISTSTVDCHMQPGSATPATGEVLPPVAGTVTIFCSGGGDVPSAADADDSEDWA